ncbi:MAG TPA: extracellular solute-binding protein [Burkholderiales bacterium]|nr:extracellular solute-binding protein [Burkholderiales bacterium]
MLRSLVIASLLAPTLVLAQGKPGPHAALYLYKGADRDAKVLAGAKKEGKVVVYTSLNTKDSVPISEAFEKKYGVKVELWRSSSEKVLQRAVTEFRAGRFSVDSFELNGPELEQMWREGLLDRFYSPQAANMPPGAFPKNGAYVADRFNFFTIGYNTSLVKPADVPKSYADLLDPKWVGRIGIEASDTDWFGSLVHAMGEEKGMAFFRKLADMKPQVRTGHTLMAELVASGEVPLALDIYNHNAERLKAKGAPIDWKPLEPTFGRPNGVAVAKQAAHPNAALLFVDYMLSLEGQQLIKKVKRVPASNKVDSNLNDFPYQMIDPVVVIDEADKWEKRWSELFLKGQAIRREKD